MYLGLAAALAAWYNRYYYTKRSTNYVSQKNAKHPWTNPSFHR